MGADLFWERRGEHEDAERYRRILADTRKIVSLCKSSESLSKNERLQVLDIIQTIAEKAVTERKEP